MFSKTTVLNLTDRDMEIIANKMADDYCTQLFWEQLPIIVEYVLESKKKKHE